jgi:hypothetical protein
MSKTAALVLTLVLVAAPAAAQTIFTAELNGANNVPPQYDVTATGTATFTLNAAETEVHFHIEYRGLSSPEIGAHVHVASPRDIGPIAFVLPEGRPKDGVWEIPPEHVTNLRTGHLYVNIHTEVYVTGEIRGQLYESEVAVESITWGAVKARYH